MKKSFLQTGAEKVLLDSRFKWKRRAQELYFSYGMLCRPTASLRHFGLTAESFLL